jgi:hypothetical protein
VADAPAKPDDSADPEDAPISVNAAMACFLDAQMGTGSGYCQEHKQEVTFPLIIVTTEINDTILNTAYQVQDGYRLACGTIAVMAGLGIPWALAMVKAHNEFMGKQANREKAEPTSDAEEES